uniref:Chemokine interleukin-8-like domain-containing protein n=1 Tax=Fundulus heteroclitus TaxID=8078 RepID=A0A3Q2QVW1_FUNHE
MEDDDLIKHFVSNTAELFFVCFVCSLLIGSTLLSRALLCIKCNTFLFRANDHHHYPSGFGPAAGSHFTMKSGKEYCADPDQDWAKEIIKSKEKNQTKGVRDSTTTIVSQKQTVVQCNLFDYKY